MLTRTARICSTRSFAIGIGATLALSLTSGLAGTPAAHAAEGSIGDRVWFDDNYNGIQDPGEQGAPGIAVTLYDGLGELVGKTVSDADGNYVFTDVADGTYYVGFDGLESNWRFSPQYVGDDPEIDSNASQGAGVASVYISAGQQETSIDAGIFRFGGPWMP